MLISDRCNENFTCNSLILNYSRVKDMPIFAYTARETATGREIRNSVEAATEQAAIAQLLNRNLLVVEIKEKMAKRGQT